MQLATCSTCDFTDNCCVLHRLQYVYHDQWFLLFFGLLVLSSLATLRQCCGKDSEEDSSNHPINVHPIRNGGDESRYNCSVCCAVDDGTTCTQLVCPTYSLPSVELSAELVCVNGINCPSSYAVTYFSDHPCFSSMELVVGTCRVHRQERDSFPENLHLPYLINAFQIPLDRKEAHA